MGEGDNSKPAQYVTLKNDGTVDLTAGIKDADGQGGNLTKTNQTLMGEMTSAGAGMTDVAVIERSKFTESETDPTKAFGAGELVAAIPSVTPVTSINFFTGNTNNTTPTAPTHGPVYTFAEDAHGTHAAGNYIVQKEGTDYFGYLVTGSGPYQISGTKTALSGMDDNAFSSLGSPAFTIQAPTNNTNTNNNTYTPASGESTEASSKQVDLSGLKIYSIDADVITETNAGVSKDGLYAFKGADGAAGWDAYRLGGNAQQGWNVVEKVAGAYSAKATFEKKAAGELTTRIVDISDGDVADATRVGGSAAEKVIGKFALKEDTNGKFDAYEVTGGGNGAAFEIGEKIYDNLFADANAVTSKLDTGSGGMELIGYLETASSDTYVHPSTSDQIFEIERVAGERYGNIVTYGVKLKAGELSESVTFDSLTFNVKWEKDVDGASYDFWGQFKPASHAPAVGTKPTGESSTPVTFFEEGTGDGITFGMFADKGIKFDQDEYIATFMLDKTNNDNTNKLYLNTAQYTLYDAENMDGIKSPITPLYGVQGNQTTEAQGGGSFSFSYADHTVGLNLENIRKQNIDDVELLVTDVAKGDGLSLVPVGKNGNLIKYQVVMNVPIPTFIQAAESSAGSVKISPDYKIDISGATIFDESVTWLTPLAQGQTAALTNSATVFVDGTAASASQKADPAKYYPFEFYDTINAALNPKDGTAGLADLDTSTTLSLEIKGLNLPAVAANAAEGRYVVAEFSALSGATTAIQYASSQGDGSYGAATTHKITRMKDSNDAAGTTGTPWDNTIKDGSEVTALADKIYLNEQAYNDAIGAEDALGALKISRDGATKVSENKYSQTEIIAADFNMDGKVSSADAYDILNFSVHGVQPGAPKANWVYVDDIANNGATPKAVTFDYIIDAFAGQDFDIGATAILIGDVSSSYSGLPTGTTTARQGKLDAQLEALTGLGIADMKLETATSGTTVTATAGRDLIFVGDAGVYTIDAYASAGASGSTMSGDIIALSAKVQTALEATGAFASDVTLASAPTAATDAGLVAKIKEAIYGGGTAHKDAVLAKFTDAGSKVTHIALGYDTNGDEDFSTADDLLILVTGTDLAAGLHYVGNPLDVGVFDKTDFDIA